MGPPARLLPVAWRLLLVASGFKFLKKISWFAISYGDSELRFNVYHMIRSGSLYPSMLYNLCIGCLAAGPDNWPEL